jgi:hypothetical protein
MHDQVISKMKSGLGTDAFAQAWAEGMEMELEQAIDTVLAGG